MTEGTVVQADSTTTSTRRTARAESVFARIDRYSAWLSGILLFLHVISGFGMTNPELVTRLTGGLVSWRVAYDMHGVLHIPLIVVFTIHTFMGIRHILLRKTKRKRMTAWVAAGLGAIVMAYLLTIALSPGGL